MKRKEKKKDGNNHLKGLRIVFMVVRYPSNLTSPPPKERKENEHEKQRKNPYQYPLHLSRSLSPLLSLAPLTAANLEKGGNGSCFIGYILIIFIIYS